MLCPFKQGCTYIREKSIYFKPFDLNSPLPPSPATENKHIHKYIVVFGLFFTPFVSLFPSLSIHCLLCTFFGIFNLCRTHCHNFKTKMCKNNRQENRNEKENEKATTAHVYAYYSQNTHTNNETNIVGSSVGERKNLN